MAKKVKTEAAAEPTQNVAADAAAKIAEGLNPKKSAKVTDDSVAPTKKTAARSNFKGTMTIPSPDGGILSVFPVKTYVAVDTDKVERHMYHSADCKNRLEQGAMTCTGCGETISKSAAVKGFDVNGAVVLVNDAEIKSCQPMGDKSMKILEYIDESEINPTFYEDAEFVVPDKGGEQPFAMLVAGLKQTGKVAKGVRVKGGREQYFTLRPYGQHGMTMHYLRADYEVRDCNQWTSVVVVPEMAEAMAALIEATAVKFTPAPQDAYLANVRKLVATKAAGETPVTPTQEAEPQVNNDDLLAKLQASVAKAKAAAAGK
jgi:DNA end-binding protein Ku